MCHIDSRLGIGGEGVSANPILSMVLESARSRKLKASDVSALDNALLESFSSKDPDSGLLKQLQWLQRFPIKENATPPSGFVVSDTLPFSLEEASTDLIEKGEAEITIVSPGYTWDRQRFYPAKTLKRDYKVFEGAKMYVDHDLDQMRTKGARSLRDWVGSIQDVFVTQSGEVRGRVKIIESWFKDKIRAAQEAGLLGDVGVSHSSLCQGRMGTPEGGNFKAAIVEGIRYCRSVDFVSESNAGGTIHAYESFDFSKEKKIMDEEQVKELIQGLESRLEAKLEASRTEISELQESVSILTKEKGDLERERDELKQKVEAQEQETFQTRKGKLIEESELPEAARKRVEALFGEGGKIADVEEAIKNEKEYFDALSKELGQGSPVKNFGPKRKVDEGLKEESIEELTEGFRILGLSEESAKFAAQL